ncbi:MAG: heme o synthase [Deltaproteobacteria bacterium]|nr:heme o synthase [Deltaproteobacteria bacterium]
MVPRDRGEGSGVIEADALREKAAGGARAGVAAPGHAASALLISKPGIAAGVALAGLAGMVLAARGMPEAKTILAGLGSIVAAASGAAILNGVLDEPMDVRMPRLSGRVAALGTVGKRGALLLAAFLILAGLTAARRSLNPVATTLVATAVVSYAGLYTLWFKRRSPYGTIPGGVPGALPVLIGYTAVTPRLGADGVLLFLVMLLWQPPHFWSLALKYQDEYRAAGVPVLPAVLGEPYTKTLIFIYAAALLPLSLGLWALGYCSASFAAAAGVLWAYFVASLYFRAVRSRRFGRAFGASILYILGLLLAVILDLAV